tara:strand:- start:6832 stop:7866 length:1035 start_codon:yes stop_codon:yes gene_type:complete
MAELPQVSICTPTFNRRPFFNMLIECFNHQTYSKSLLEWIIVDDGTDKIIDLVQDIPEVKYYAIDKKISIGKKRNMCNKYASGDIIIYMDDDDYYLPNRVEHVVSKLLPCNKLCAGCNIMYIWDSELKIVKKLGPYSENHCTAATLAFKKELLLETSFDDNDCFGEEKSFLKNYTLSIEYLNPQETLLVNSHPHNTYCKKNVLMDASKYTSETDLKIEDFISNDAHKEIFINICNTLHEYSSGLPINKPDILVKLIEMYEEREKKYIESNINNVFLMKDENGIEKSLDKYEILGIIKHLQSSNKMLLSILNEKEFQYRNLYYKQNKTYPEISYDSLKLQINQVN